MARTIDDDLKAMPPWMQEKARRALGIGSVVSSPAPQPVAAVLAQQQPLPRPNHSERRRAHAAWPEFAAEVRKGLPVGSAPLMLWLPGLQLYSENVALRGERKTAGKNGRDKIRVQSAAMQEAQFAIQAIDQPLWKFVGVVVRLTVLQCGRRRDIDPGNLYHKALVDCLIERGGGLGLLEDDGAKYVSTVTVGYGHTDLTGVEITITPEVSQ